MNGIQEMWKYGDKPGYVTVDKPVKREPIVLVPRVEEPPPPKRRVRNTAAAVPATGRKRRKSRKREIIRLDFHHSCGIIVIEETTMSNWFDVDKAGLAKLMAGRPKAFVLFELLQNAWDEAA